MLGSTRITNRISLIFLRPYIIWCKQKTGHRQTTERISELLADRYFLDLPETCLYMGNLDES